MHWCGSKVSSALEQIIQHSRAFSMQSNHTKESRSRSALLRMVKVVSFWMIAALTCITTSLLCCVKNSILSRCLLLKLQQFIVSLKKKKVFSCKTGITYSVLNPIKRLYISVFLLTKVIVSIYKTIVLGNDVDR